MSMTCDGEEIQVHRCVVAAVSPVFKKMLETSMTEANSQTINIPDVESSNHEPSILQSMANFMYTGSLNVHDDLALAKLALLGHCYDIKGLSAVAAPKLRNELSPKNIVAIVRMLRPYKEDEELGAVFYSVLECMQQDSAILFQAAMEL